VTFLAPDRLWLLLLVAGTAAWYVVSSLRRPPHPVTFSALRFAVEAQRRVGGRWRRHLPAAVFLGLLALLAVGFARPALVQRVPTRGADLVVALDTSISMQAQDVPPTRLEAARRAAIAFVRGLPPRTRVGVVAFDGSAELLVSPTGDRARVEAALRRDSRPEGGTAIGDAVAVAAAALVRQRAAAAAGAVPGARPARRVPARVVLLSDGENTAGRPVETAAQQAARSGVPVDTISFGTPRGIIYVQDRFIRVPVADDSLRRLAAATRGRAHRADSAGELAGAYSAVADVVGYRTVRREVSAGVGALAALLAALVGAVGLRRVAAVPTRRAMRRAARSRPA
jgi:Ca-activated chloride channel family protein